MRTETARARSVDSVLAEQPGRTVQLVKLDVDGFECDVLRGATALLRDVRPILQDHCQSCHRPGEVAPMPLMKENHGDRTYHQPPRPDEGDDSAYPLTREDLGDSPNPPIQ
jgi:hypothetical protein